MQNLKYIIASIITVTFFVACDKYDIQGFFVSPSKERVNERFEQSMAYNEQHQNDTLITTNQEEYLFYTAADVHVKTTAEHLAKYIDIAKSDEKSLFTTILGDITDQKKGLFIAHDTIENHKDNSIVRVLAGNHDIYFDQWSEYYELFGSSTYYFVVKTPTASDLFIALDSSCGSLGKKQMDWLQQILEEKRPQHRHCIIMTHTHFFDRDMSQFPTGNFSVEETAMLTNLFTKNNVNLVISGHDHHNETYNFNGVQYLVLDDIQDLDPEPTYFVVDVKKDTITFERTLLK
ncbi:MAG: metallophosphoesterase [Paludibacteraceae bacterium]|nr:metallophosphoesterase [Paludibacteraceae bacterium]